MRTPPWVKVSNLSSHITIFHLYSEVSHKLPEVKRENLISDKSVAGAFLPTSWLANSSVHGFLTLGKLPTTALPNRL